MGCQPWVKVVGDWKVVDQAYVKVSGAWRTVSDCWSKVNGVWVIDQGAPSLPGGVYILSPTSQSIQIIPGGAAFASFATTAYRGRITEVRARVSWTSRGSMNSDVYGRHSNTFYRNIAADVQWANRTIDHRLDTFSGNVLPQFNSGSAIGYQLQVPGFTDVPADFITALRLNLTIV